MPIRSAGVSSSRRPTLSPRVQPVSIPVRNAAAASRGSAGTGGAGAGCVADGEAGGNDQPRAPASRSPGGVTPSEGVAEIGLDCLGQRTAQLLVPYWSNFFYSDAPLRTRALLVSVAITFTDSKVECTGDIRCSSSVEQ